MRGAVIFVLLIAGLLFFGCACPTPPANGQNATGTGVTDASGEGNIVDVGGSTGVTDTGTGGTTGNGEEDSGTGATTGGETTGGTDYSNQDFTTLVGTGVPLQCDITTTADGTATTIKLYMKGEDEWRGEADVESGGCSKMVWIKKGDYFYMGCADSAMFGDYKWLVMKVEPGTSSPSGSSQAPDLNSVPPADIKCLPWAYDASKFAVSGNACSMEGLAGYPSCYG